MEFSRSARAWGMRIPCSDGFVRRDDPGVEFPCRKAACSISVKLTKSEFVRNGVMAML